MEKKTTEIKDQQDQIALALYQGDDYELCFTAPIHYHNDIQRISEQTDCAITTIGTIIEDQGLYFNKEDNLIKIQPSGFDHFKT